MQHEVRFGRAGQCVDELLIIAGAQCRDAQRLRFTACEQRRAVCTRQKAGFGNDLAHGLGVAPVNTWLAIDDGTAQDRAFQLFQG